MDDSLQPSISALEQLSPSSQEMVKSLIQQLAERENITIPLTLSTGLQTPIDGLALWEANCISEGLSPRTIAGYKILIKAYLDKDPFPTTLSIKQFLASKMKEISPIGVGNYVRALHSLFSFLKAEGFWGYSPSHPDFADCTIREIVTLVKNMGNRYFPFLSSGICLPRLLRKVHLSPLRQKQEG